MLDIVPAIIPKTFAELEEQLEFLRGVSNAIQIDICDGKFAGPASWPLVKPDKNFESIVREERGLPLWEDFDFEFDLLIADPFSLVSDLIKAGASKIVLHASTIDLDNDLLLLDQLRTDGTVEVGIAFELDADEEKMREFYPYADFIQFMAIEKIGSQGQAFNPDVLEKIKFTRRELPNIPIAVDGGMNADTAGLVIDAGATKIIAGSYILKSTNPLEAMRELKSLI